MTDKGKKKDEAKPKPSRKPPEKVVKSFQMDLFSQFLANDLSEVSNTVEYWERIPKYFFSTEQQNKLREPSGLAQSFSYEYKLKNNAGEELHYKVKIQPALIEQPDGKDKAFFPTKTEENIEEVLKKIFTEQNYGIHDPKNIESWVRFSYGMIRRELYRMGSGLRYDQIKHSLEVMSKCILTVYEDGKEIYTGSILQDYCSIDRNKYLEDTDALHVARLPVFISHAINTLQYRQFNYARFMECGEQLTRFLYKRLVNRFINANYMNDYHLMFSDIQQASGLLQQARDNDNRRKVLEALEELKKRHVISEYNKDERKEGRKVIDIKYTIRPHHDFIAEQKAANKRANMQQIGAQKSVDPVGK
ncbi:MAG: hypothetical protein WAW61_07325 [Methylococcaceae bacterium]